LFVAAHVILGPSKDGAIGLVPPDAGLYASIFVRPSTSQKMALDDLLKKFPGAADSFDQAKNSLVDLLDPQLARLGLHFDQDVDPWLGNQVAAYLVASGAGPGDGAALLRVRDEGLARAAVGKALAASGGTQEDRSYGGIAYSLVPGGGPDVAVGFIDGFLVVGTETGFKLSVDASGGESLRGSDTYRSAVDPFQDDQIALLYADSKSLSNLLLVPGSGTPASSGEPVPVAFALHARSDGAVLESSVRLPDDVASDVGTGLADVQKLVSSLPQSSWLALTLPRVGELIARALDAAGPASVAARKIEQGFTTATGLDLRRDVLSWLGDTSLSLEGTTLGGAGASLVASSSDAAETGAVVERVRALLDGRAGVTTEDAQRGDERGFSVRAGPLGPLYVLGGDRLIVAYGDAALGQALGPDGGLPESDGFTRAAAALGDGYPPLFYLDATVVPQLVQAVSVLTGPPGPGYETDVKPVLDSLDYIADGAKVEGRTLVQRLVIGVR
jgi:hypothetical protein